VVIADDHVLLRQGVASYPHGVLAFLEDARA
jgi:hypothetical protein